MGHEYDHHSLHHHRHFHRKTIFLPMFCRLSNIKDIITLNHGHCKNPISAIAEPSSPKVSCMGQVNRNNRVTGFPSCAGAASISGATHHHRYSKLKRLFSGKILLPPTTASVGGVASIAAGGGGRIRSRRFRYGGDVRKTKLKNENEQECVKVVNIGEIDPPLPVVKRVAPPGVGGDEVNLWRRRFNGAAALKGLQIEQVTRLPNRNISSQPPTI